MPRRISRRSAIARLLDDSPSPVFVLDPDHRIAYANLALGAWLELDPDKMTGLECTYSSESGSPVAGLCPPPEVFEGVARRGKVWRLTRDRETEHRDAEFLPLSATSGDRYWTVAVIGADSEHEADPPAMARPPVTDPVTLHGELWRLRGEIAEAYHIEQLIGQTPVMQRVRQLVRAAATQTDNVLVFGPRGTGREHVARTLHRCGGDPSSAGGGGRHAPPLVTVLCETLNTELLQSAVAGLLTRCEELDLTGVPTLLLLNADAMDSEAQTALVELLNLHQLKLRCVSTALCSLIGLSRGGEFDEGLAFALSGTEIEIPSLDQRLDDIPLLVQRFVEIWNADSKRQIQGLTEEAMGHFLVYPWSEHLAEMKQLVFEACGQATSTWIDAGSLPFALRAAVDATLFAKPQPVEISLDELLARVEKETITQALQAAGGNRAQAARMLGVNRTRLLRRISHLAIADSPEKKDSGS